MILVPKGDYTIRILSASLRNGKTTGVPFMRLEGIIISDEPNSEIHTQPGIGEKAFVFQSLIHWRPYWTEGWDIEPLEPKTDADIQYVVGRIYTARCRVIVEPLYAGDPDYKPRMFNSWYLLNLVSTGAY